MADLLEVGPLTDAAAAVALGKRHLLVRDYNSAVNTLIQACELLVQKHGDGADELAEPYLLYGRALLNLAREESNVLGSAVPCEKDSDEEVEGDDDEEDEEEAEETEEKSELIKKGETSATSSSEKKGDNTEKRKEENKADEKKEEELKTGKVSDESAPKVEDKKSEEKKPTASKKEEKNGENVTDDTKVENNKVSKDEATPGSSKMVNGESSSSHLNGNVKENGEDDEEVNDDEDADNLEVAWEVLELAKLVLLKRGPSGWQLLAEAHKLLGEVAMEGGNAMGAVTDFHACLDLLQKIEPCNPRAIAEIYYQLGLAYSFANDFDSSIEQFKEAGALLEARIKELEEISDPPKSEDPFYTVDGEIKELKELLPEIEEKISDMKDAKQEACRLIIEGIREKASAGSCSNGAGTSTSNEASSSGAPSGSSDPSGFSTSKPVTDISHLIRKKRKPEEIQAEESSPCKQLSPQ